MGLFEGVGVAIPSVASFAPEKGGGTSSLKADAALPSVFCSYKTNLNSKIKRFNFANKNSKM